MVQRNIRFMTTGQLMTFCNVCQKMNADITVKDVTGRFEIDAKSIVGLMTMHLLIEGEEEHLADSYFEKFDCTPVTIPFS